MPALLVVGYGNTLRRDDALGLRIAELAGERRPDAELRLVRELTPELAEPLSRAEIAVFVDARRDRAEEGVLCEELSPGGGPPWLGHASDPRALLALAEALFGKYPRAWLVTAPAADFELGEGLSSFAMAVLPEAVSAVTTLLAEAEPR